MMYFKKLTILFFTATIFAGGASVAQETQGLSIAEQAAEIARQAIDNSKAYQETAEGSSIEDQAAAIANQAVDNSKAYEGLARLLNKNSPEFGDLQAHLPAHLQEQIPDNASTRYTPPRLMVFLTLSMPEPALKGWMAQTQKAGGVVVIRGFYGGKLSTTQKRIHEIHDKADGLDGGFAIDPTAFSRLGVTASPTVVILDAPLPACQNEGCVGDFRPPSDRIAGNTSLNHALSRLVADGDVAPHVAQEYLERLISHEGSK